ncbi:unnamed protein product [Citrullus colocynthis]|uniref:Uncharacterized protein n=1 Tax=Citrullus colocynthis TaxID=252529 RepID=A0ABP0XVA4_9ROSI
MDVVKMSNRSSKYECLLFDMDDTLYPRSCGINLACRKKIEEFMLKYLHIDENEVPQMCLDLYMEYGTTMAGLKALGYEFDNDEFHAYVHATLPYEALKPDPILRNLLLSMPQRKIIFTNADKAHAAQVLQRLDLEDCFEGVICFETLNNNNNPSLESKCKGNGNGTILCKPSIEATQAAIKIADTHPNKTIFFDDSVRNIESGKAAGLHTVIFGTSELIPEADHALGSIHNIKEALPELWEGEEVDDDDQPEQVMEAPVVETMVLA